VALGPGVAGKQPAQCGGVQIALRAMEAPLREIVTNAGLMITTEAMVAELPKKEAAGGHDHGGDGMGGMDF